MSLTELGASYPDVVDLMRKSAENQFVNCPVVHWTTPEVPLETLVEMGKQLKSVQ
jgi:hypothetical protein